MQLAAASRACAIYARYSSDRQNPKSCEDQVRACRQYAAAQGWSVVGEWRDEARSGALGRDARDGWNGLLTAAEGGAVPRGAVVLVWDLDRWSRDWSEGMIQALSLHRRGIDLADTSAGLIDQASLTGRIMLALKVGVSDEFCQATSSFPH